MKLPSLLRRPAPPTHGLPGPEAFGQSLRVELMRADRGRSRFCLAVFDLDAWTAAGEERAEDFAAYLTERLRATDYAGLLGAERLGVILWDTDEAGAARFVDKVRRGWVATRSPEAVIYAYPSDRPIGEPPTPARKSSALPQGFAEAPPAAPVGDADAADSASDRDENDDDPPPVPVLPLEEVLLCPLPPWKRAVDVVGAAVGLAALSPLLLATAAAVKLTSPGPALFRQTRDGLGGRKFLINKFRTMVPDAEALKDGLRARSEQDGPAFKMEHDPRITPLGRWLRKTCIDELPQLWNVLVGDMSLVGPRPLDSKEMAHTGWWERRRLLVTPGLTCIWQVDGKSKVTFKEWMRMDIRYMHRRTFAGDLGLIFRTACNIAMHRGSH
ncbi:sugar transferase [Alienimonas californiensis]|uniref:UDP-N-acetylgalactosamine-undecaprenyl-phosphate N-acetylgalactosaminephosphotransferase n=1 Tax=Alienimonas californiensis TaxID=2527989 RepID=A0A517PEG2_9PLAN|nr:sugar transferase [Alienimonas californiensis]QDT17762.1 UDP-N-acetylgalactosamine-undecaprenyl-phosphate N-acetylgalactosaminephosphotransferase [Alienimonas californiensis]